MTGADVLLHVGMQQSGAGLLQRGMSRLRPELRRRGVAWIDHRAISGLAPADGWAATGSVDRTAADRFGQEFAVLVAAELDRVPAGRRPPVVAISSDNLLGTANLGPADGARFRPLAPAAIEQVVTALAPSRVRILIYTRRQDRLLELCYLREVLKGSVTTFDQQFPYADRAHLDYRDLLARVGAVPGVQALVVRPVELFADRADRLAADLLGHLGLAGRIDVARLRSLTPPRLPSDRGLAVMQRMAAYLESAEERSLARSFVLANFPAADGRAPAVLLPERRRAILDAYREANVELFRTHLADLPPDSYGSDAGTLALAGLLPAPRLTLARRVWLRGSATARGIRRDVRWFSGRRASPTR